MRQADVIYAFFNLGTGEVIILLLVILLLFGAKRLPELARGLGKGINEFKDAVNSGKEHIMDATDDIESESDLEEQKPRNWNNYYLLIQ